MLAVLVVMTAGSDAFASESKFVHARGEAAVYAALNSSRSFAALGGSLSVGKEWESGMLAGAFFRYAALREVRGNGESGLALAAAGFIGGMTDLSPSASIALTGRGGLGVTGACFAGDFCGAIGPIVGAAFDVFFRPTTDFFLSAGLSLDAQLGAFNGVGVVFVPGASVGLGFSFGRE